MKRILMSMALVLSFVCAANAQSRTIGGRFGYGLEVAYQHTVGDKNMISAEAGFGFGNTLNVAATYDWLFPITGWSEAGSWNWYAGVGAAASIHSGIGVGVAGRLGIEYNFEFPLTLSVDYKPVVGPYIGGGKVGFYDDWSGAALAVRYRL